jgi:hypothetical protein
MNDRVRDRVDFTMRIIRTIGAVMTIIVNMLLLWKLSLLH